eukprot:TRINITY_DN16674_c0_g1_i1.p1 TRINITY_DN16674_c0_g1~~TRINITY_DN16674_c0_g1_i1.p1  ORF type:complete len:562 (-),score=98.97 TRINITY_DN16674_c0_g1_i1:17-1702(-)
MKRGDDSFENDLDFDLSNINNSMILTSADKRHVAINLRSAFVYTIINLLGVGFIYLIYLNYLMLKGYITSFVLAMIISLFLWPLKTKLLDYLSPFKVIENQVKKRGARFSLMRISWEKIKKVSYVFFRPLVLNKKRRLMLGVTTLIYVFLSFYSITNSWKIMLCLMPLFLAIFILFSLIYFSVNQFIALILQFILIVIIISTTIIFTTSIAVESGEFAVKMLDTVNELLADKEMRNKLEIIFDLEKFHEKIEKSADIYKHWRVALTSNSSSSFSSIASFLVEKNIKLLEMESVEEVIKDLQTVYNFNSTVMDSLVSFNYTDIFYHPVSFFSTYKNNIVIVSQHTLKYMVGMGLSSLTVIFSLLIGTFSTVFGVILFIGTLNYLLMCESLWLDVLLDFIPLEESVKNEKYKYRNIILKYIRGIILCTILRFFLHAICVGVSFHFTNVKFKFTSMFISGILAVFPVLPTWFVYLGAFVYLQMNGFIITSFFILIFGFIVCYVLDNIVLSFIELPQTYITGLAVVFGIYAFSFEGILIGPLIVIISFTAFEIFNDKISQLYKKK